MSKSEQAEEAESANEAEAVIGYDDSTVKKYV